MIYYAHLNGSAIVGYDQLNLATRKAEQLRSKYPSDKITVEWTSEGKRGKDNYHILKLNK